MTYLVSTYSLEAAIEMPAALYGYGGSMSRGNRISALLLVIVLVVAACGGDSNSGADAPDETTTTIAETVDTIETAETTDTTEADGPTETTSSGDTGEASFEGTFSDGDVLTLITATDPGGGFDFQLRNLELFVKEQLAELTGADVDVIVENVPGAGQLVGYETMSRAEPNGLTLAFVGVDLAAGMQVIRDAQFDIQDWTYIAGLSATYKAFMAPTSLELPEQSIQGLIDRSQETPLLLGVAGAQTDFIVMQQLLADEGVDLNVDEVLFDGTSDMVAALLRGDIELVWTTMATLAQYEEENPDDLELIGTTACERQVAAEDVPTIVEEGIPNAEEVCSVADTGARAIVGPPGIPEAQRDALMAVFEAAINDPEHVESSLEAGHEVAYVHGDDLGSTVQSKLDVFTRYEDILRAAEPD
ncbi:MAG: hypothetical protein GEU79_07640 [Acidimicrobiia bacterium]|nr:hypothetical protein [Acidimicrobiia bacterium]